MMYFKPVRYWRSTLFRYLSTSQIKTIEIEIEIENPVMNNNDLYLNIDHYQESESFAKDACHALNSKVKNVRDGPNTDSKTIERSGMNDKDSHLNTVEKRLSIMKHPLAESPKFFCSSTFFDR